MTDATGTTTWGYDAHKRLVSEDGPFAANDTVTYAYVGGRQYPRTTPGQVLTFTPDVLGRVSTVSVSAGPVFNYAYLNLSRQVAMVLRDNHKVVENTFDPLARLTAKVNRKSNGAVLNSYAYDLDDADRRTRMTFADNRYWDYSYDAAGQLTGALLKDAAGAVHARHGYGYDPMGNPLRREENGQVRNYTFNNLNQFASATAPEATDVRGTVGPELVAPFAVTVNGEPAAVDAEGNWIRQDVPLAPGENQLAIQATDIYDRTASETRTVTRGEPPTFAHDLNGNSLVGVPPSGGLSSYTWNEENRLSSAIVTDPVNPVNPVKIAFSYDGLGRRRVKQTFKHTLIGWTLQSETRFVYDGNNLVAELDENNVMTRNYVWGVDLSGTMDGAAGVGGLLTVSTTSGTFFPTFDGNGNVTSFVDSLDFSVSTAEYSPFGKIIASTGNAPCSFGFSTIYRDDEIGLLMYRFRDYDPVLGRWPSRDPIGEMGGVNLYAMVGNDAVNYVDMYGLLGWDDFNPASSSFFLYDEAVTGVQTAIGLPFSVLSGDIFSGLQDVSQMEKHSGCDFLITINGIWNDENDARRIMRDAFRAFNNGRDNTSSDYNSFIVRNSTGAYDTSSWLSALSTGLIDFAQIAGHELGGIDNAAINAARAINKAQETGEKNCCDVIKIRVVAHSQGTMIFKRSLGYVNEKAMGNIHYQGFGGQAFIPNDRFAARNVWNYDDSVPFANFYTPRIGDIVLGGRWKRGSGAGHGWDEYWRSIDPNF